MLKSSRKAFSSTRFSLENKELPNELFETESTLVKPEERFKGEVIENLYYRSIVTLALGKNFSERSELGKQDVDRFTLLYQTDSRNVKMNTYLNIIPLRKKGFSWESSQSSNLRRNYRFNADRMFDRLELCDFDSDHFESGSIELVNIPYKTTDYLEFSSAAALVDKRPYKRINHNSGDAVYFRDFYLGGERGMLFSVVDALSHTPSDHKTASALLSLFKKFFNSVSIKDDENVIFSLFTSFLNSAEEYISSSPALSGASISLGIVYKGNLYYLNIGDCRIYGVSFYPELKVKKITIDDGMAGLIERGAAVKKKEFFSQLKSPEFYVGCFSQTMKGRRSKKVIRNKINPVFPNMGRISLEGLDFVLVATDGFWTNLPMIVYRNKVVDASGEEQIRKILSGSGSKNPKQILESLYNYSKSNMKLKRTVSHKNYFVKPNAQDIGLLGFFL